MPRFDLPDLTRPVARVLSERGHTIGDQDPLPPLTEPPVRSVSQSIDEPLEPVINPRIRLLNNYWHGGWDHAVPACLLRVGVAARLYQAVESLPSRWGLAVFDAWRPLELQTELYSFAQTDPGIPPAFLAKPSTDPTTPPPHLTGGAVDLTLTIDGVALALGCGFDDTTARAHATSIESEPGPEREGRRLLYHLMHDAGFVIFEGEWWHFEFGTTRWASVTGQEPIYGPASSSPGQIPAPA